MMTVKEIRALPLIQEIINAIEDEFSDVSRIDDDYGFLEHWQGLHVCYGGETKTVFLHDDWDFVVKVPNYGRYKRNYCALEVEHYASAVKYGCEKVLLETAILAELANGVTLYVQQRYQDNTNDYYSNNRIRRKVLEDKAQTVRKGKAFNKAFGGMYDYWRIDKLWFARVLQLYGKRFCIALEKWSKENKVGDLHNSNTGWFNDKPIILDYAGYYG